MFTIYQLEEIRQRTQSAADKIGSTRTHSHTLPNIYLFIDPSHSKPHIVHDISAEDKTVFSSLPGNVAFNLQCFQLTHRNNFAKRNIIRNCPCNDFASRFSVRFTVAFIIMSSLLLLAISENY